ncbi:MAG: DUF2784 domain-containing protein [Burkholderiales bacterium]
MSPGTAALLADAVLLVHVCVAIFVVAGWVLIVVGSLAHWQLASNLAFRLGHLAAIAVVVAESWFGVVCPLTTLEMSLRVQAGLGKYSGGFIEYWLSRVLFYEAPPWVFVIAYTVFGVLVAASWWYFPPKAMQSRRGAVS